MIHVRDKRRFTFCIEWASTVSNTTPYEAHVRRLFSFYLKCAFGRAIEKIRSWSVDNQFSTFQLRGVRSLSSRSPSSNESKRWKEKSRDEITERFSHHREQIIPRATIRELVRRRANLRFYERSILISFRCFQIFEYNRSFARCTNYRNDSKMIRHLLRTDEIKDK